jgi:hypothetical protein
VDLAGDGETPRLDAHLRGEASAILRHRVGVVAHVVTQVERGVRAAADSSLPGRDDDVDTELEPVPRTQDPEARSLRGRLVRRHWVHALCGTRKGHWSRVPGELARTWGRRNTMGG